MGAGNLASERTPLISGVVSDQTTVHLYVAAVLSAVGGFLFGYDTGVVSGALLQVRCCANLFLRADSNWMNLPSQ